MFKYFENKKCLHNFSKTINIEGCRIKTCKNCGGGIQEDARNDIKNCKKEIINENNKTF
jgi:hypothetical protein